MKMKTALYGLLLVFFALALNGCAGSKKTRCSCPNFRGSRAIYGKVDAANFRFQVSDFKRDTSEVEAGNADSFQLMTFDYFLWR